MHSRGALAVSLAVLAACGGSGSDGTAAGSAPPLCDPVLPAARHGYSDADAPIPRHFVSSTAGTVTFSDNTPSDNPITNAGATLGRVLFYDVRLSANDRVSCATCHRQAFGFGDTARFSPGLHGGRLARKTLALANARFNPAGRFFWDERAPTLEAQVLEVIQDTVEMGMDPEVLEGKLAATSYYPGLFASAFGSPDVTRARVAAALAQFVRSLISSRSRFDAMFDTGGAPDPSRLTAEERAGFQVFNAVGCVNCHRAVTQFADRANNTGLDLEPADTGAGQGRFKPASLRNIAVRPPYMHDGRFTTLRQVVEFYDHGVEADPNLDPRMRAADGSPRRLDLTPASLDALVSFLESLTDPEFLRAERFSDPFPCRLGGAD